MKGFDVLDLEGIQVKVIQPQQSDSILLTSLRNAAMVYLNTTHVDIEAEGERLHEVCPFLESTNFLRMLGCLRHI